MCCVIKILVIPITRKESNVYATFPASYVYATHVYIEANALHILDERIQSMKEKAESKFWLHIYSGCNFPAFGAYIFWL